METLLTDPTKPTERIQSLDVLRGFAILGILVMNIQSFSMVGSAYFNPTSYGDLSGINLCVYFLSYIFAESKFMTIFTILFGAGIVMITSRLESKGSGSMTVYYRRTFVLLIIGCLHAYMLWYGDVLVWYSLCGLWLYFFRKLSPKWLMVSGILLLLIGSSLSILTGMAVEHMPEESLEELASGWSPSEENIQAELEIYRSGWLQQMEHRVAMSFFIHTFVYFFFSLWRAGGLMLIGMALFKTGVLTAERSNRFYISMSTIGILVGFPLVIFGLAKNYQFQWVLEYSKFFGNQYNYWGSILVSLSYIGVIMLVCKAQVVSLLTKALANVGRTALSNYLMQTIICTTLFYGHGFGLFGQIERSGQLLIVLCIWTFQLIVSAVWLKHFRFGPAEWLWRSLTYFKFQPINSPRHLL
jgi:uncharacterized protein